MKIEQDDDNFLTFEEAKELKQYLDGKNNFKDNCIIQTTEDDEPDIISLVITSRKLYNKEISLDEPIEINQCKDLNDYNLAFDVLGYLNQNELTQT